MLAGLLRNLQIDGQNPFRAAIILSPLRKKMLFSLFTRRSVGKLNRGLVYIAYTDYTDPNAKVRKKK